MYQLNFGISQGYVLQEHSASVSFYKDNVVSAEFFYLTFWSEQHCCADTLKTRNRYFVLLDTEQITRCWIKRTNLTVNYVNGLWSGQIDFIIVLLYGLSRVSQLTVIILLILSENVLSVAVESNMKATSNYYHTFSMESSRIPTFDLAI